MRVWDGLRCDGKEKVCCGEDKKIQYSNDGRHVQWRKLSMLTKNDIIAIIILFILDPDEK